MMQQTRVYPRACGGTIGIGDCWGCTAHDGSIPARAGEPGRPLDGLGIAKGTGLSPRVRGNRSRQYES